MKSYLLLIVLFLILSCNVNDENSIKHFASLSMKEDVFISTKTDFKDTLFYEYRFPDSTKYYYVKLNQKQTENLKTLIEKHHKYTDSERAKFILDNWDKENDLAVLATKAKIPPLKLSKNAPWPGYWVMAVGTADGYAGSIAFGNVLNVTDLEVLALYDLAMARDRLAELDRIEPGERYYVEFSFRLDNSQLPQPMQMPAQ